MCLNLPNVCFNLPTFTEHSGCTLSQTSSGYGIGASTYVILPSFYRLTTFIELLHLVYERTYHSKASHKILMHHILVSGVHVAKIPSFSAWKL